MTAKQGLIITGMVGFFGGLGLYLWRQYSLLKGISVKLSNVKFNKLSLNNLDMVVSLSLTNASDQRFTVDGYDLDFYIGDILVAKAQSTVANVVLKAGGVPSVIPIGVSLSPVKLFKQDTLPTILKFISNVGGGLLRIKGKVSVRHPLLYLKDYDVDFRYTKEVEAK